MTTDLFWCMIICTLILTILAVIAVLVISWNQERENRVSGQYEGWYLELWSISCGDQIQFHFPNSVVLGRLSLYDHIVGCPPTNMDPTISRDHCMLFDQNGAIWAWNLSAVNPAMINGHRLNAPCQLIPGDRLELGNSVFLVTRLSFNGMDQIARY